jgi:hypothetical protein
MLAAGPVQSASEVAGGGPVAFLVTLLVAWAFYTFTLHLAATFFVGDVPTQPAAAAALAPAVTSVLIIRYPPVVVLVVTLVADALAIRWAYDLAPGGTAAVTVLHFAFTTALVVALNNLFGFV